MTQRDYAALGGAKKKNKRKSRRERADNIKLLLSIMIVASFAAALYIIRQQAPKSPQLSQETETRLEEKPKPPKSTLPAPPEEVWSYIKALETRTIPVEENPQLMDKKTSRTKALSEQPNEVASPPVQSQQLEKEKKV